MSRKKLLIFPLIFLMFFSKSVFADEISPVIKGESAITVDVDTKEIIYSKNIDTRRYPASITKIVTAMLLAENKKPDDLLSYSKKAKAEEPFILDLPVQDKVKAKDAMDALLLFSANDIAYMISENISGTSAKFSELMNNKVKELNLKNTHFITPNGLHDPNHYSTAYDISVLGRNLYNYPWIMDTMKKKNSIIKTQTNQAISMDNKNKLIGKDGCIGGKTGYTSDAGRCLLALYERNGRRIIGVVLKSEQDANDTMVFRDMEKIINWSYSTAKEPIIKKDTTVKKVESEYCVIPFLSNNVKFSSGPLARLTKPLQVELKVKEDILRYKNDVEYETVYDITNFDPRKLNVDTPVGKLVVKDRDTTYTYNIYPTKNFDNSYINRFLLISSLSIIVLAGILISLIVIIKKRRTL